MAEIYKGKLPEHVPHCSLKQQVTESIDILRKKTVQKRKWVIEQSIRY